MLGTQLFKDDQFVSPHMEKVKMLREIRQVTQGKKKKQLKREKLLSKLTYEDNGIDNIFDEPAAEDRLSE